MAPGGRAPRICPHFLLGRCSYGSSCKYSHDEHDISQDDATSTTSVPTGVLETKNNYVEFRREIRCHQLRNLPPLEAVEIWTQASIVLDGTNRELHQFIARDLADDEIGGPAFVAKTVRLCNALQDDGACLRIAHAFLRTITHPMLLRSLSIDDFVGTIYRIISGSKGDQGIAFFSNLSGLLTQKSESPKQWLSLIVVSAYQLLRRERKCLLNDEVSALLASLEAKRTEFANLAGSTTTAAADFDDVGIHIEMMKRMVDRARGRLPSKEPEEPTVAAGRVRPRSTFPMEVVVPGGKHDNDFADIIKIQISPTLGEITSDVSDYLPLTDFTQPHFLEDPVQRHLDSAFRLLRHDIFGPLKEAISSVLAQPDVANAASSNPFLSGNIKAHSYSRATIQRLFIDTGLEAHISFTEPPQLRKYSVEERRVWWEHSSRLEPGGLLCFVAKRGDESLFLLFIVTKKSTKDVNDGQNESTLVSKQLNPTITARLASETQQNMSILSRIFVEKQEGLLVELPGLIPDTFVPILENLQRMMRDGHLAFRQWILPTADAATPQGPPSIPPPVYARRAGFRFSLKSISHADHAELSLDPAALADSIRPEILEAATGLDRGQSQGLIAALTREYALIQGPPGTGKSYVGVQLVRVLLDHKLEAKLGPILVICYTNHALDQFLKHLLDVGIDKIIRIGGQSRTEELDGKNLRVVSRNVTKTVVENRILGQNYSEIDDCLKSARGHLHPLLAARKSPISWKHLRWFLVRRHPRIARQFEAEDADSWTVVGDNPIQAWLRGARDPGVPGNTSGQGRYNMAALTTRAEEDINSLLNQERWALAESWVEASVQLHSDCIFELLNTAKRHRERVNGVHDDVSRRTLAQADVVGVTATGLARNIKMLRHLGAKVIICEEAAEVMEPHLISALMPGVEHFIQIGDHRQLRPQIQNYLQFSLETPSGRAYQLDRSQFERRAVGEPGLAPLPVAQLNVQRRMRPEISNLIRSVYPRLEDHDSVKDLPCVIGMRQNLFWLDHSHPEDSKDDGARVRSHSNPWEVSMAAALVRHLVRQGEYKSTDIALLTPYTGQLQKLRAALSKEFEVFLSDRDQEALALDGFEDKPDEKNQLAEAGRKPIEKKQLLQSIRLATVDNFQGEEAKVIVVSLVRSNNNCKVGFLRTENRIKVLLSRAQHGMYLIGNARTYQNVRIWADVHRQLSEMDAVGTSIALCCPRHPNTSILCSEPEDFRLATLNASTTHSTACSLVPVSGLPARIHAPSFVVKHVDYAKSSVGISVLAPVDAVARRIRAERLRCNISNATDLVSGHARVDMLEFKTYGEIDLDESPIAVLGCGHFFTGESLDGMVGMSSVYTTDKLGNHTGLQELSGELTAIPTCPDCRVPIRQFATKRYNRVVNKAVLDEISKRFLVGGRQRLDDLEERVAKVEQELSDCRATKDMTEEKYKARRKPVKELHKTATTLEQETAKLRREMDAEYQPTKKLFDAILTFQRLEREQAASLEQKIQKLDISSAKIMVSQPIYDQQITLGAQRLQLRIQEAMLRDSLSLLFRPDGRFLAALVLGNAAEKRTALFLNQCRDLIAKATEAKLPRLVIPTCLAYARIAQLEGWYCRAIANNASTNSERPNQAPDRKNKGKEKEEPTTREIARTFLITALGMCDSFPGGKDYRTEVEQMTRLFEDEWYEEVTPEEIAAIKVAMVSGPGGIATHSGHWYTCRNGHPSLHNPVVDHHEPYPTDDLPYLAELSIPRAYSLTSGERETPVMLLDK
ncbi:hypothetical protein VTI74DRAFT_6765 [Chaetomium olivicolor]